MATIREQLLKIPVHGELALNNAKSQRSKRYLNRKIDTISDALLYGFAWRESPEGYYFWQDIHIELSENEQH